MIGAAGDRDKEVEMWVICFARLEQQQAEISVVGFHGESFGFLDDFFGSVGDVHKHDMCVLTFAKKTLLLYLCDGFPQYAAKCVQRRAA